MRTVVLGPNPALEAVIARRQQLGQDLYDEVWEGEYHMAPAPTGPHAALQMRVPRLLWPAADAAALIDSGPFNLGDRDNFRVPDVGYHRVPPTGTWLATAAIVMEIVSPDDETWAKFDFYLAHGVEEIIVVDPAEQSVRFFLRSGITYAESDVSLLLGVTSAWLAIEIDWPVI